MNYAVVFYIVGWLLRFEAFFLLLPCFIGLIYSEASAKYFAIVSVISFIIGFLFSRKKIKDAIYTREGFVSVASSWIIMSAIGALPFYLTGEIPSYFDALFETVSGFTTTGASILNDVEVLSHASLFWRSFTHWIGGMGVFVFMMALLPLLGGSNMNLMRAESPGPSVDRLVPHIKDTAKILYLIYLVLTTAEFALLCVFKMPAFDAICITFGTVGTGGFGVLNSSCGAYTTNQQNIITIFMFLSGINFTTYFYLASRKIRQMLNIEEVRYYFLIIVAAWLAITLNIKDSIGGIGKAAQQSIFQIVSMITTTGYSTCDYEVWPEFSKTILVILMFSGACAGSTGGGIKVSRVIILLKTIKKELQVLIHPRAIRRIRIDGKTIPHEVLRSTNVFIAIYFALFLFSLLLVSINNFDFTTNFTAVLACFNNIGPGLSQVGPSKNFADFSVFSKCVLMFDMLAGRLELFPVLLLFTPSTWQRQIRKNLHEKHK